MKDDILAQQITNREIWEEFNLSPAFPAYFQSWDWGEVQKKIGIQIERTGFYKNNVLIAIAQISDIRAKRGHFLHVRHGPVLTAGNQDSWNRVISHIRNAARKKRAAYIRISPLISEKDAAAVWLRQNGFIPAPIHNTDAENRWILPLGDSTDIIFAQMRKTTRNLIRKAEKMKIKIERYNTIKSLDSFFPIYEQTAKKKKFVPHSLVREEFDVFSRRNTVFVYFAILNNEILSTAVIVYYGSEAIYRHAGTSEAGRKTPASYLLQWHAIQDAKKEHMQIYNFYGIAKDDNPHNPWFGLTQFKKGFGGEQVDFLHAQDLPLHISYWFSYIIDTVTEIGKGYKNFFR